MNKAENNAMIALTTLQVFLFGLMIYFNFKFHLFTMEPAFIANISMDCVAMVVSTSLYVSCVFNKEHSTSEKIFITLVLFETFTLFTDAMCWYLQGYPEFVRWTKFFNSFFYSCAVIQPLLSWHYQTHVMKLFSKSEKLVTKFLDIFAIVAILVIFMNNFFGYYFTVDPETGIYSRQKYYILSNIYPVSVFLCSMFYIFTKKAPWQVRLSFMVIFLCPYLAMIFQIFFFGISFTYVAVLIALFTMYMNIHVNLTTQYSEMQKQNLEQKAALAELQNRIMISQIQPHFMYNTLTTIHALCSINPDKAAEVTEQFAKYLRGNISSLDSKSPISFETELKHTKIYADIEMERFENIQVIYDIQYKQFVIPALSVQPLVENAIRHGVRSRDNGIVRVTSEKINGFAVVTVEDNGKGFVPGESSGSGTHIGLSNITERVQTMVKGTVTVESQLNVGSKITISIPLGEQNESNLR